MSTMQLREKNRSINISKLVAWAPEKSESIKLHLNKLVLHFACFEFTFILCEFKLNRKFLTRHKIDFKLDGKCFAVLHYIKF